MKPKRLLLYGLLSLLITLSLTLPSLAIVFVNASTGNDANSGLNWANAVKTIKKGVEIASSQPDLTVWVAKGTYTEIASIQLPPGLRVYGGFNGNELPPFDLNTRIFTPPTIVQPTAGTASNSIFVAFGNNIIDGFTIQGGAANVGAAILLATNTGSTVSNNIIQNNTSATAGAGIFALASGTGVALRIEKTKFKGNRAANGGAVYADGPSVIVVKSVFEGNTAHFGGAIAVLNGYLSVDNSSTFSGNTAKDSAGNKDAAGGAIYASKSSVYVNRSTFGSNSAQVNAIDGGSATGGAIYAIGGATLRIEGCYFDTNLAVGSVVPTRLAFGGAVYVKNMPGTFRNNIFAHNAARGAGDIRPAFGGAIYFANPGQANIRNNTFYDNSVTPQAGLITDSDRPYGLGAAIFLSGTASASIINNIITRSRGTAVVNEGMSVTFNYNLLWHNAGGDTYGITFPTFSTNPALNKDFNIMKDPQFRHAPSGDLHITYGSPARDAGLNSGSPNTDIDGEPRPFYSGVQLPPPLVAITDIGADEFVDTRNPKVGGADNDPRNPPTTDPDGDGIFNPFDNCPTIANVHQVDSNGDGIGDVCPNAAPLVYFVDNSLPAPPPWPAPQPDGLTWATAFRNIQQAIDAADLHNRDLSDLPVPPPKPWWTKNAEVWVRGGAVPGGQTYTENISIWHGVAVYGAWKGPNPPTKPLGELPTDVPDPHPFRDLNANQTTIDGTLSGSVVMMAHLPQDRYLSNPNAPIFDTALKSRYDNTITVLDSFRLINGLAEIGGGVSIYKDLANVSTNRINYNQAALGGGVYIYKSASTVGDGLAPPPAALLTGDTTIFYNQATGPVSYAGYGGGVYVENATAPLIFANIIQGNRAYFGAGIASRNAVPLIKENLIGCECSPQTNIATGQPNSANGKGGGVYMDFKSQVIMDKNTIVNNVAQGASAQGGGIYSLDSNLKMQNTIVANNVSQGTGAAIWAGGNPALYPWLTCPWCYLIYNDFWNNLPAATAFTGIPNPTTGPVPPSCSPCTLTNLAVDPMFVNPSNCAYNLAIGSPLRGAGIPECPDPAVCPVPNIGAFQDEDPPVSIADAKKLGNGTIVQVASAVVTAVFPEGFYIEQTDRSSAIKVAIYNAPVYEGQVVDVAGVMSDYGLERQICNPQITLVFPEKRPVIRPLAMSNNDLGGIPVGPYKQNPLKSTGPCNLGLLITTWGRVTQIIGGSSPGFVIDDGSRVGVKVILTDGLTLPAIGTFVSVTGICTVVADEAGKWTRAIRPRSSSDVIYFAK